MLPVTRGAKETRLQILFYTLLCAPFGLLPAFAGLGGWLYLVIAGFGGLAFIWYALRVFFSRAGDEDAPADMARAKALFGVSILYLFGLFAALLVEHALPLYFAVGAHP